MAGANDVKYKVTADTQGANAAFDQLEKRAAAAGEAAAGVGAKSAASSGGLKKFQEGVEKSATAASGLASALGTSGRGGAVLGALSNLASASAAGGPLLVGLAALAAGAAAVGAKLYSMREESEKLAKQLEEELARAARSTQRALAGLGIDLVGGGDVMSARVDIELARAEVARLRDERLKIQKEGSLLFGPDQEQMNRNKIALDQAQRDLQMARLRLEVSKKQTREEEKKAEVRAAKKRAKGAKLAPMTTGPLAGYMDAYAVEGELRQMEIEEQALLAKLDREGEAEAAAFAESQAREQAMLDFTLMRLEAEVEAEYEAAERRREIVEMFHEKSMAMTMELGGVIGSVFQDAAMTSLDAIEKLAAGEKIAFDEIAASFLRSTGVQIMGIGAKYMAEGLGLMLTPGGQANGAALMAAATVIAGHGAAMAAGGAAWSGAIRGASVSEGGGGGAGGPSRGGRAFGQGAAAGGGTENVTIVFQGGTHLGDPTERATTLARDHRRVVRDVYMPGGA